MLNAKTMFRVMNEFKKVDAPSSSTTNQTTENSVVQEENNQTSETYQDGPTFFI